MVLLYYLQKIVDQVFQRSSDTLIRKRFTLAYEIAHCCLDTDESEKQHIELRSSQSAKNTKGI